MKREKKPKKPKPPRKKTLAWLPQLFFKPRATMNKVAAEEESIKRTPLIFITIFLILAVLVAAPIKRQQLQMNQELPENFQWWSEQQQQQYFEAQKNQLSPIFMYVFPILLGVTGYLIFSLIMTSILYLSLTLAGSRAPRLKIGNAVAWAMAPFGLRELVKFIVPIAQKKLVSAPGLSGLVDAEAKGALAYLRSVLANLDFYWLLFAIFLIIGAVLVSGLKKKSAIVTTLITLLLMLLLQGIPGLISSLLGGLSIGGAGFYF
jgi:hypothetical protein